ncbi:MAG: bifunctional phosphoribosylaminoimidazolecarboxamide formyltransferase/IMP cyclohydrolase [Caldilineaceae bacterium]|nr:bifunctional phosphoribosylaminoimidazolecarboxamide formyltransferase/IMP cyclohydrolase [Caldilineaceae bacterium]MCB9162682.1 bifunctional phosphoribosylaminoimidazolecarboxamide formyltransferase/IMP cyclohydrolase [Caldilineaceae bacterium]
MSQPRALLSVSDKTGLVEFAQKLHDAGVELLASGGTAKRIADAGIPVRAVEDVTGFPEILGGRVKTLHPAIHGGILARRTEHHLTELEEYGLSPIDIVVVNLYPFQATVAQPNVTLATAVEEIDIGGVALLRAAAKNHESVTVICDPADYDAVAAAFAEQGTSAAQRKQLALKAFRHTAEYDTAISDYLAGQVEAEDEDVLPATMQLSLKLVQRNRYGENPHQQGGLYSYGGDEMPFEVLHGKEMSYNNWLDLDGSWLSAQDFPQPTVAIIKHGNPCGLASADSLAAAYVKALASDPVSAFGSIISVNRTLDLAMAQAMSDLFVEVVAAPGYDDDALELLMRKKNLRIVRPTHVPLRPLSLRSIYGGVLVQELDRSQADMDPAAWTIASARQPTPAQLADLAFAWRVARWVKSNAIVYVKDEATVGVGAGQMSRVDSVMLAGHKAGDQARGAVMASDAFFPFPDGIEAAAKHGIAAVVQPGGSIRDDLVVEAVDKLGLVMVLTGTRHFRH